MMNIFDKAKAAAETLREMGYDVEYSDHPTSFGQSAYVQFRHYDEGFYLTCGFRLSDHGIGEFRQFSDEVPTIIDGRHVTVDYLVDSCIPNAQTLDELRTKYARMNEERRAKAAAEAEELRIKKAADAAKAERDAQKYASRMAYVAKHHPDFDTLTKTAQKKIIRNFNRNIFGKED